MFNTKVMEFIVKVGIPTGFSIVLLLYVLNTSSAREERLIDVISGNNKIIQNDQTIIIKQNHMIDVDLDKINEKLKIANKDK